MSFSFYDGTAYWDYSKIVDWCYDFVKVHSDNCRIEVLGHTNLGLPILMIVIGKEQNPTLWIDGGTHASEWAGVMATLYALSKWAKQMETLTGMSRFSKVSVAVVPCVSPDGYQALFEGKPFLRSNLREPLAGNFRMGLEPQDINRDGRVEFMRWKDPAGPFVLDKEAPLGLRPRKIHDSPSKAYFLSREGLFLNWDGFSWMQAPRKFGMDLNRNFPVEWSPFEMFGMDSGAYALSEVESRSITDAIYNLPSVIGAISLHTYTGALLTQPYNADPKLPESDIFLLKKLGRELIEGTDYQLLSVHPDFTYHPKQKIIGVWADFLSTTLGIPAYTLELWNPFAWAEVDIDHPARFFMDPDPEVVCALLNKSIDEQFSLWMPHKHPQLGSIEIGGFDYLRTIRNPPEALLQKECEQAFRLVDNFLSTLPFVQIQVEKRNVAENLFVVEALVQNLGYLSTAGLSQAHKRKLAKGIELSLELSDNQKIVQGEPLVSLGILQGWGQQPTNAIYPSLGASSHRKGSRWLIDGSGKVTIYWDAGKGGQGRSVIRLG